MVTTRVGGIPETIETAKTGFWLNHSIQHSSPTKSYICLSIQLRLRKWDGLHRKTILEKYDWRIVVKDAIKVYDEALKLSDLHWFTSLSHRYFLEKLNHIQGAEQQFRQVFVLINFHLGFNRQIDSGQLKLACDLSNLQPLHLNCVFFKPVFLAISPGTFVPNLAS